jgi:hypothetical protein
MVMTGKELRQARIDTARAEIARLSAVVTQQPVKDELALAGRDVSEAAAWLTQENIEQRPSILAIVALTLNLADWRIGMVKQGLTTYGPDFTVLG